MSDIQLHFFFSRWSNLILSVTFGTYRVNLRTSLSKPAAFHYPRYYLYIYMYISALTYFCIVLNLLCFSCWDLSKYNGKQNSFGFVLRGWGNNLFGKLFCQFPWCQKYSFLPWRQIVTTHHSKKKSVLFVGIECWWSDWRFQFPGNHIHFVLNAELFSYYLFLYYRMLGLVDI